MSIHVHQVVKIEFEKMRVSIPTNDPAHEPSIVHIKMPCLWPRRRALRESHSRRPISHAKHRKTTDAMLPKTENRLEKTSNPSQSILI